MAARTTTTTSWSKIFRVGTRTRFPNESLGENPATRRVEASPPAPRVLGGSAFLGTGFGIAECWRRDSLRGTKQSMAESFAWEYIDLASLPALQSGEVHIYAWPDAEDSPAAVKRYEHPFYRSCLRLWGVGYNWRNLGGL